MKIKHFKELEIWKSGNEAVLEIHKITKDFPRSEVFGIVSQLRRASVSVPSNIAEGFNRCQKNEYRRFLKIALGSCAELETQAEIAADLKFLNSGSRSQLLDKIDYEPGMIMDLIKKYNFH